MTKINIEGKFIAFNGAMASGKTTQAKLLAAETGAALLLGQESLQPEITSGDIYTQGSSAEVERWFVDYHVGKLATFAVIPEKGLVSDMSLQNDLVWGRALINDSELPDFESYYHDRSRVLLRPDIALLFLLPPPVLLERVQERQKKESNRRFESHTKLEFLERIQNTFIESRNELGKEVEVIDLREEPYTPIEAVQIIVRDAVKGLC